jgi:hypothetical protein
MHLCLLSDVLKKWLVEYPGHFPLLLLMKQQAKPFSMPAA